MAQHQWNGEHTWTVGEPITQEKMNSIEGGIAEAHERYAEVAELDNRLDRIDGGTALTGSQTLVQQVSAASTRADNAYGLAQTANTATADGREALSQIQGALARGTDSEGQPLEPYQNLDDRLDSEAREVASKITTVESNIQTANTNIGLISDEITRARGTLKFNGNNAAATSLKAKLDDMDTQISTNLGSIGSTRDDYNSSLVDANGHNYGTLQARLNSIDSNISDIEDEIEDARGTYTNLDGRLDADETAITSLQTDKVNVSDIVDNLNQTDVNKPLSAKQGNVIKQMFGTGVGTTAGTTVSELISTAQSNAESNAESYVDGLLGNGFDTTNTVAARIDAIDNASTGSIAGLDTRISALETEIDMTSANSRIDLIQTELTNAHTSSIVRTPGANDGDPDTDTTYGSLDARLEAIESAAAATKANVATIAGELAMVDGTSIVDTNTRVDTLENDLRTMAAELDMLDGTAIVDTNTRVDDLEDRMDAIDTASTGALAVLAGRVSTNENDIDALETAIGDANSGLIQRINTAESDIDNLETAVGDASSGLTQRVGTLETTVGNSTSGLVKRVTDLETEPKSATVVYPEDQITYDEQTGNPTIYPNSTKTIGTQITPSTDVDYLLGKDNKYYYWKYIQTGNNTYEWALISGGGGSGAGNSSGVVLTLSEYNELGTKAENTDYFVSETDGYHHYRWIPGETEGTLVQIEIGNWAQINKNKIKRYNIATVPGTKQLDGGGTEDVVYLNLYQYDYDEENNNIDTERPYFTRVELPKGGGGASSTTVNNLIRIGNQTTETIVGSTVLLRVFYSSWDGPQSNDGTYVLKAGSTTIETGTVHSGAKDEEITGWKENTDGYYEFDVSKYCKVGATSFTLTVTVGGVPLGKSWSVDMKDLRLETTAPDTLLISSSDSYDFSFTAFGAVQKTLYVYIDGTQVGTQSLPSSSSGRETSFTITPQMVLNASEKIHGAHTVEMYISARIGGVDQRTDSIIREYIWYDANDTETPVIIASPYNNQTLEVTQYSTVKVPYQVYKKGATSIDVYYYLDEDEEPFDHVTLEDVNVGQLSYLALQTGAHTLIIQVDDQTVEVNLAVSAMEGVNISPVEKPLIDFDPVSLTNSSTNRLPEWETDKGTFRLTASDNFNWSDDISGGGYKEDEDGKCFVIKAGSYVDLNYKMFERREENGVMTNILDRGAEIKVIFKTKAVRSADAIWFSNIGTYNDKTVGIQLGAHTGWLKTDKAADSSVEAVETEDTITINNTTYNKWKPNTLYPINTIVIAKDDDGNDIIYKCKEEHTSEAEFSDDNWLKMGAADTEILATNSYLYLPYSEKDKIELDININKYVSGSTTNFIMAYEDGVPSKAYAYTYGVSGDGIVHNSGIRIGSPDCDVYLYHLRIYNKSLDTDDILQNFIADGKDIDEKVERYNRNCIYWDPTQNDGKGAYFTSPSGTATLDPIKLAERMPNVKILMLDTPVFTVGKKNFVQNSTLRCIHSSGGQIYESRGDADNWFFQGGFHAGQGTTSDNYGQSSRNVDFLFEVDGVHYPTKAKNMKNYTPSMAYRSSLLLGEDATKWNEDTQTWEPTSIYDENTHEWVPNEDILSAEEIQRWTAHEPEYCSDWKGDDCKVSLTSTSIPNNYFNLKVNVASSENVNNALFQERFNEFLNSVYESPAYKRNHKIKNDMEFVPAILFVRENDKTKDGNGNYSKHTEFNDTNWHFYSLGNIGDSKKSDYTRAYNPYDMGEFTVENSDNNTNNGQFQSGVFMYNGIYAVETDYPEWNNTTAYAQGTILTKEGRMYQRAGADMAALGENEVATWVAADWNDITPVTTKTIYYAPRTNPNPMEYLYGIDPEEWNTKMTVPDGDGVYHYINRKHDKLVTEKFDGDHSFEFRYACLGDYRDGDLINDTTGLAKSQEKTNQNIVFDFYEWLVTATNEEFASEATNWFVPTAMEFFYAFTHYYTMMDNRAKNTFWHWGKRYISTNDANGVTYTAANNAVITAQEAYDAALSDLEDVESVQNPIIAQAEADIAAADATLQNDPEDAEAIAAKEQAIEAKTAAEAIVASATATKDAAYNQLNVRILKRDELKFLYEHANCFIVDNNEAAINDGRRFDLWAYDMDTAAGIDNNGALVFPYGKEDEDYRVKGEASSGYAFNGAGSIFWRRLKTTFADDIVTVMNNVDVNCFNSEDLINQFDQFQNCFPEEIWRLDIERKYIRTFTGASIDNSITTGKQNPRFLTSMMQGRKKYQRRQWIRDQGVYFNSKYRLTDIIRNENTIEFNIITPTNSSSLALQPSYNLQLTPYQDMYLNVTIGNGGPTPQIRAEAGKTYTLDLLPYSSGTFAETRLYIYGFNHISGIGNLAPMYPYSFTLSALEHLKVLDLGTDVTGYSNANFTVLPFSETTQLPLLETLNVKNCNYLAGSITLNTANNLRTVEATGTAITGISLPEYTNIETLHLPASVGAISLYGARFLKDFKMLNNLGQEDYSRLYTLDVYDSDYSNNFKDDPSDPLPVDWISIAIAVLDKQSLGTRISLKKLYSASIGDIDTLQPLVDFKSDLESAGGLIDLAGTIHVMGAWSEVERDSYGGLTTSVWPQLQFDTSNGTYQARHAVTYRYSIINGEGETVAQEKTIYIKHGDPLVDIYDNGTLTSMPAKQRTARESYQFGLREYGSYKYMSGWKIQGSETPLSELANIPPVTGNTIIEAYFKATTRTYQIRWLMNSNLSSLVKETLQGVEYGEGADQEAPTVAEIHAAGQPTYSVEFSGGSVTYSIFKGWEKLPINIDPGVNDNYYNIYALWDTETIALVDLFADTTNLTPQQLLVYAAMSNSQRSQYVGDKVDKKLRVEYELGHDSIEEGTSLIDTDHILRLDIANARATTVQPMTSANDAFTIVIDFSINPNYTTNYANKNAAIIASCYYKNNSESVENGFALYYNLNSSLGSIGPRVGYGQMFNNSAYSVAVGNTANAECRNIVVLRHIKGDNKLYVYSSLDNGTYIPNDVVIHNPITYGNSSSNSNAYLNFGQLTSVNGGDYSSLQYTLTKAGATIYYAKYWDKDLGVGECKRLAAWPHEKMTYVVSGISSNPTSGSASNQLSIPSPALSLTSFTASNAGRVGTSGSLGWGSSMARTICNNRVYNALPTELQAIVSNPETAYYDVYASTNEWSITSYVQSPNISLIRDYIHMPSVSNLTSNSSYINETNMAAYEDAPFDWLNNSVGITVYDYNFTNNNWVEASDDKSRYWNLRFALKPISENIRVFRMTTEGNTGITTPFYNYIIRQGALREGDIFIDVNNSQAYMYVTNNDIQVLGVQTCSNTGIYAIPDEVNGVVLGGGWTTAKEYLLRSMAFNTNSPANAFITASSDLVLGVGNPSSAGSYLNYSFAI